MTHDGVNVLRIDGLPLSLGDCIHRGAELRRQTCATCSGGKVRIKVFACPRHGECTIATSVGVKVCNACEDFTANPRK